MRYAILSGQAKEFEVVKRYLPRNYDCFVWGNDLQIVGLDVAGWTLEDYVIPRLASGMYYAREGRLPMTDEELDQIMCPVCGDSLLWCNYHEED